jgi:PTS system lactose-specific IIA component
MTREEVCVAGYDIVRNSGHAQSTLFDALEHACSGDYEKAQELIDKASELICKAQSVFTLFEEEKEDENFKMQFVVDHGHDHLMTTVILRDLVVDLTDSHACQPTTLKSVYKRYH